MTSTVRLQTFCNAAADAKHCNIETFDTHDTFDFSWPNTSEHIKCRRCHGGIAQTTERYALQAVLHQILLARVLNGTQQQTLLHKLVFSTMLILTLLSLKNEICKQRSMQVRLLAWLAQCLLGTMLSTIAMTPQQYASQEITEQDSAVCMR